jgi:chromosome segregation ATPase
MTAEERRMRKAKAQMDQSKSLGFRAVEELLKAQSTQSKLKRQCTMAHLKERSEEFRKEMLKNEEEEASKMNQLLLDHKKRMEKAMETSKKVNGEITEQLKSAHCVNTQVAKSMAELGISTRPTVSEWLKKKEDEKRNAMKSSLQSWQRTKSQRETAISLKQAITSHRALHHMAWSTKKDLIAQLQATKEPKPLQTQKIPSIKTKQSPEKPSIIKRQHAATVSGGCIRAMPIDYMKSSALLKHRSSKSLPGESSL